MEIGAYLRAGKVSFFAGYSYCRFQCGGAGLRSRELTDGTWAWPEGLAHYEEVHKIKLRDEFVAHAAKRKFQTIARPKISS